MYKFIDPETVKERVEEWGEEVLIEIVGILEEEFNSRIDKFRITPGHNDLRYLYEIESPIRKNFCYFINMESVVAKKSFEIKHKVLNNDSTHLQEDLDLIIEYYRLTLEELKEYITHF